MIREYRKISTIKAEQFDGSEEMMEKYRILPDYNFGLRCDHWFEINHNTEDQANLLVGDWIVTDDNGNHAIIIDYIFKKTYQEVGSRHDRLANFLDSCELPVDDDHLATQILKVLDGDK